MPPQPGAMSPGVVIRYARQEWARGDWRAVVYRVCGLHAYGADAVNQLRQTLDMPPATWCQIHRIATRLEYPVWLSPLSFSHHVLAYQAPDLFPADTLRHAPGFWLERARQHAWSVRQLQRAMRHPDLVQREATVPHDPAPHRVPVRSHAAVTSLGDAS